ncbi:MAG TPA: LysR family transcriptional regulator [Mesorhizobium sp.]|jgi:DNA-binding transcriptional LysR family regulator|uniref:LysR family transcriptional regulator n=1 Tax=Mesorhizobium sp. TaxID=1871066 RepID=UPI002DDCD530|nr:LysR family transcriptional regulator [Mesorhizobium sp.]HEV2506240.1 LysR family transcriptional regulator [Mesorhizobium sp.]
MDRLGSMALFVTVAEAGSLSAAGRGLGMPLATVSRRLSDLEKHLGTRLLNRSTRRLELTEAGRSYLAACRRILEEIEEAEQSAAGEYSQARGELVVTAPIVFGRFHVLPVVVDFLAAYPEVDVRLTQSDTLRRLVEEHIDLAVRIGHLPDSSMVAVRVGSIRRVACASPSYLEAHGEPTTLQELGSHHCVTVERLALPAAWTFMEGQREIAVPVRSRLTVNTAEAAIDAATAGVGIARVLSYQVADAVRSGALKLTLEDFEPEPWPVSLVHTGRGLLPLKLRAFLDFAAPRLKARLAGLGI